MSGSPDPHIAAKIDAALHVFRGTEGITDDQKIDAAAEAEDAKNLTNGDGGDLRKLAAFVARRYASELRNEARLPRTLKDALKEALEEHMNDCPLQRNREETAKAIAQATVVEMMPFIHRDPTSRTRKDDDKPNNTKGASSVWSLGRLFSSQGSAANVMGRLSGIGIMIAIIVLSVAFGIRVLRSPIQPSNEVLRQALQTLLVEKEKQP